MNVGNVNSASNLRKEKDINKNYDLDKAKKSEGFSKIFSVSKSKKQDLKDFNNANNKPAEKPRSEKENKLSKLSNKYATKQVNENVSNKDKDISKNNKSNNSTEDESQLKSNSSLEDIIQQLLALIMGDNVQKQVDNSNAFSNDETTNLNLDGVTTDIQFKNMDINSILQLMKESEGLDSEDLDTIKTLLSGQTVQDKEFSGKLNNILQHMLKQLSGEETLAQNNIKSKNSPEDIISLLKQQSKEENSQDLVYDVMQNENSLKGNHLKGSSLKENIINNLKTALENNKESEKNHSDINVFSSNESKTTEDMLGRNASKGEDILKNLIKDNKDAKDSNKAVEGKIDKAVNFMNNFMVNKGEEVEAPKELTISKNSFVNDVIKTVKYMDFNGIKDLTVKVVPKELGEVIIKLTMDSGILKAQISATNKDTYSILQSNLHNINEKLNNTQIKVQNVSINIYNEDASYFAGEFNKNGQGFNQSKNYSSKHSELNAIDEISSEKAENKAYNESEVNMLA